MRPYFAILAVLAAAVSSCVYPYDLPELAREQAFLVVDGSIVVGKEASLRISWINKSGVSYSYTKPDEWWVEDENGTRYLPERDKQWMDLSQAPEDRSYRMVVKKKKKTYSSSFEKGIDKPIIESIDFGTDEARVYCNVSLRESDAGVGYVALSFEEIWLFHAQYPDQYELKEIEPGSEETPGVYEVLPREKPDESRYWCWRYADNGHETLVDLTNLSGAARDYRLMNRKFVNAILSMQYKSESTLLRIEPYWKKYRRLPLLENGIYQPHGYGSSKGIDIFVEDHSLIRHLTTTLSYSFNDSKRLYLDYTEERTPDFASRHNLRVAAKYSFGKAIIGLSESYASGRHFPNGTTTHYNSVDMNLTYLLSPKVIIYTSVNNIFGRTNIFRYHANGTSVVPSRDRFFYIGIFVSLKNNKAYDISNF